jgi:ribosomal protein L16 Arg81 hydroxylase
MPSIRTQDRLTAPVSSAELDRIVEPKRCEEFLAEDWQRQPLVVQRGGAGRFDDLLSVADVERLVCSGIRYPAFRLVKEGEQIPLSAYTADIPWSPRGFTGTADVQRVVEEFEAGATIVLQGLHHHWPPLAEFCRGLEASLGHPVQANSYYTPRGSQGLAVHHDTHDVFVLQVAGEKRWLVYEPVFELPLRDQKYKRDRHGEPGPAIHDLVLRSGDVLYLPRGWLHEALTSEADSLHITVGVNVYTWIDAVRAAVDSTADDVEFRRAVPEDGEPEVDLLARLAERLEPEQVLARQRQRFVRTRRPVLGGQIRQVRALDELDAQSELERRPTVIAAVEEDDESITLAYEGKRVTFPPQASDALLYCMEAEGQFTAEDLPGDLDEPGRLVLVRRLVREGFLRVISPEPDASE